MDDQRHPQISLQELETVALDLLEDGRRPLAHGDEYAGVDRAANVRTSLILRLLVRIPMRQRNVRELELERNLFGDPLGHWRLRFAGAELKVRHRGGRPNIFELPFPKDLVPDLETYLESYRPQFLNAETSPYLFLTARGQPLSPTRLRQELRQAVQVRTGKPFDPHRIRTIWATEYFSRGPGDFYAVAYMLNDTITTVLNSYYKLS
jgi:integrase